MTTRKIARGKKPPPRILMVSGNEETTNHRSDFETCPHCGHYEKSTQWRADAMKLVLNPRFPKADSVTLITECPKCFELSWVHWPMDAFRWGDFPETWKKAVADRAATLKLAALREWARGLCGKCRYLESGTADYTAWRHCIKGTGAVESECQKFKALRGKAA